MISHVKYHNGQMKDANVGVGIYVGNTKSMLHKLLYNLKSNQNCKQFSKYFNNISNNNYFCHISSSVCGNV